LFEFAEEVLNQVACFVEFPIIMARILTVTPGRNHNLDSDLFQGSNNTVISVISLVRDHRTGLDICQENICTSQIVNLA
jgi:hypothetical protein